MGWYVLLFLGVLVAFQAKNARGERTVLRDQFGERYEIYRRRTWF
jgi:protein-S-isoprenylcysteine O-methyltransferase Ste14